jgi:copper chaperone
MTQAAATTLKVENIHCESCAKRVTTVIGKVAPDAAVTVDVPTGAVTVAGAADMPAVVAALDKAGYPAAPRG